MGCDATVTDHAATPDGRDVGLPSGRLPATSPTLVMVLQGRELAERLEAELRDRGLSLRKLGILGHLHANPGASLTEVARRAGITVASVHTITASLAAADVVRSGSGGGRGRPAMLELTPRGEQLLAGALRLVAALDRECFDGASGAWAELGDVLRRVALDLRTSVEPAEVPGRAKGMS